MGAYRLSHQAEDDLRDIWAYIAADSADEADRIVDSLRQAFSRLGDFPDLGARRDGLGSPDLRFFPSRGYLIAYRPSSERVDIHRVLSDYRDVARELEG